MRWPLTSTSSSEPPPRSPTIPSGLCIPETTPSAESSASRRPDSTSTGTPQILRASAMNGRPLRASRQAAVAIAHMRSTPMVSHRPRKRLSAPNAFSTASGASRPVVWTSRPRPASTFSLKIGVGLRVSPS